MKFILSKAGLTLLILILILSYGLYDFYTTGVTGGRTGRDAVRDEDPIRYYFYMALYTIGFLCAAISYVYLFFNPHVLDKKIQHDDDEDEDQ